MKTIAVTKKIDGQHEAVERPEPGDVLVLDGHEWTVVAVTMMSQPTYAACLVTPPPDLKVSGTTIGIYQKEQS